MNHNRSGSKYNPSANWVPGMSLITVVANYAKRLMKQRRMHANSNRGTLKLPKRLHVVKLHGKGDHLTNGQRFAKNHKS